MREFLPQALGIDSEISMLFGISFGYADRAAVANDINVGRIPFLKA
ncbi:MULTISPECIES: hypothetical protein [Pseudomonas]|nr:hypothetical protein [Pseudomonas sp. DCB_BI]MCX2891892.1 hypothetical protein [Pseudomonas sp. DCB_BI]